MGKKLDALLGKRFKAAKCKTLLRLTVSRIKILKNRKEVLCKHSRNEVAELVRNKQVNRALQKVEQVIREQNMLDVYSLLEGFCEATVERLRILDKQKTCPNDLKEAIATLIFAAPRCGELQELQDIRSMFGHKYGKDFITSAMELQSNCEVNKQVIEKMSTIVPNMEIKIKLLKEIAPDAEIDWKCEETNSLPSQAKEENGEHRVEESFDQCNQEDNNDFKSSESTTRVSDTLDQSHLDLSSDNTVHEETEINQSCTNIQGASKEDNYAKTNIESAGQLDKQEGQPMESILGDLEESKIHSTSKLPDVEVQVVKYTDVDSDEKLLLEVEVVKYTDVVSAAQAAFVSAAYAAAAARAAVTLAKGENGQKANILHQEGSTRVSVPESEDGPNEEHESKQNEAEDSEPADNRSANISLSNFELSTLNKVHKTHHHSFEFDTLGEEEHETDLVRAEVPNHSRKDFAKAETGEPGFLFNGISSPKQCSTKADRPIFDSSSEDNEKELFYDGDIYNKANRTRMDFDNNEGMGVAEEYSKSKYVHDIISEHNYEKRSTDEKEDYKDDEYQSNIKTSDNNYLRSKCKNDEAEHENGSAPWKDEMHSSDEEEGIYRYTEQGGLHWRPRIPSPIKDDVPTLKARLSPLSPMTYRFDKGMSVRTRRPR